MKSLEHVLWRGALALGLMAVGIGSGIGMPPAANAATAGGTDCRSETRTLVMHGAGGGIPGRITRAAFVVRRAPPANAGS
ncbi:MAG: hypothetical protein V4704_10365 [Pseudomonadota bacterium]